MILLAESQTGKYAYYDEYGNRYLFESHKAYRYYVIQATIEWLTDHCGYRLVLN